MEDPPEKSRLCFSVRLIVPFVRMLRQIPSIPAEVLDPLDALDPDERIPIATVHELLVGALHLSGDADIGLKAAREIAPGDYGAVEYAARSAATWSEAASTLGRFMRLINDALRFSVHTEGELGVVQLDSLVPLPRASADFQSAAFHISSMHFWPSPQAPVFEAHFTHRQPDDIREYERTFPGARLRFDALFNGFTFPKEYLQLPLPGADAKLHVLISKHAEAMLAELPRAQNLTERVRDLLTKELSSGSPTLSRIARHVSMSESTLARHLEEEGTTFKVLLEDLRRRLALRYVRRSDLPFSEIAFLLGFSQAAAFHRAFKRWTDQTPLEYRRAPVTLVGNEPE
ncbi:MAG TPA: AraC family transcriptional regulator [Polyangiales bacterium]|nr:AraC family transcriptional regulator [Polyangiales bacterium]